MSTVFHLQRNGMNLICKNQDVIYDGVYLFTNQRGLHKTAFIQPPSLPASWVSVYGSLTISQIGKEHPNGGMNEAGLVVEQTTLWQTEYPPYTDLPTVGELQWIQYMLDTCSTVDEVSEAAHAIRIGQATSRLHYFVADASGDRAIIEFIDQKMYIHKDNLILPVMTNSPYERSIHDILAGQTDWTHYDDYERSSMERLLAVTERLHKQEQLVSGTPGCFDILSAAKREDTVYQIIYDIHHEEVLLSTNHNIGIKRIHMNHFDFSLATPSLAADAQLLQASSQFSQQFVPYSWEFNLHAVRSFFRDPKLSSIFKWVISDEMMEGLARYPDLFRPITKSEQEKNQEQQ